MSGGPDANDVLRKYGEDAVRNGFDQARPFDPSEHEIEPDPEQPVPHEPLEAIDAAHLLKEEPPERIWQVQDRIPGDDVTLLSGNGGEGKSTLALQLACCTTVGFPWIGHEVRPGPSIYYSAEDPVGERHYRLARLDRAIPIAGAQRQTLPLIPRAGKDAILANCRKGVASPTPLLLELVAIVQREQPVLVVLDSAADVFGGNEIIRADVRAFINLLRGMVAIPYKCAVVLLGHPSREGIRSGDGLSGSTHWNNSVRARFNLTSHEGGDADVRVLEIMKNNRGKRGEKTHLRWVDGYFSTQSPSAAHDATKLAQAKQAFLALLRRYAETGRTVSHKGGRNSAPALFEEEPEGKVFGAAVLRQAMNALFAEKRLEVVSEGRPGREHSKIIEARGAP